MSQFKTKTKQQKRQPKPGSVMYKKNWKRRKPPSVLFEAEVWTVTLEVGRKELHKTLSKLLWRQVSEEFFSCPVLHSIYYTHLKKNNKPRHTHFKEITFCANYKNKYFRIQLQRQKPYLTTTRNEYITMDALYTKTHFSFVILTYFTKITPGNALINLNEKERSTSCHCTTGLPFSALSFLSLSTNYFNINLHSTLWYPLVPPIWPLQTQNHRPTGNLGLCHVHFSRIYLEVSTFSLNTLDQTLLGVASVSNGGYPNLQIIWQTTWHLN